MSAFLNHFTQHVGMSLARQFALSDYLDEAAWQIEVADGIISFENKGSFPVQLLGTEPDISGTWLWSWANKMVVADYKPDLLRDANRMRAYGQEHKIEQLTGETFDLDDNADGHRLSLLAVGICGADCYYRAPYDAGAGFFLIYDLPFQFMPLPLPRITTVITEAIGVYPLNHQKMIEPFLVQQAFEIVKAANLWQAEHADGRKLEIILDDANRVASMNFVAQ